jgi:hypothetical protein
MSSLFSILGSTAGTLAAFQTALDVSQNNVVDDYRLKAQCHLISVRD